MIEIPCLLGWLNGHHPLGNVISEPRIQRIEDFNGKKLFWLNIGGSIPAHAVHEAENSPMFQTPAAHASYITKALKLLNRHRQQPFEHIRWKIITPEEREYILSKIGPPPQHSRPIYIITRRVDGVEKVSYIGKTINQGVRFSGGHLALSKLLNPAYDGQKKSIFFCSIHFGIGENYNTVSIDFLWNNRQKNTFIECIEAMLINAFKPELNTAGINASRPPKPVGIDLSIQNSSGENLDIPIHSITDEILRVGRNLIGKGY